MSAYIYYFDEQKGYERELKSCENQSTCFVDEMQVDQSLEHIVFRRWVLHVPREKQTLQKLLSLYHPGKSHLYTEYKPQVEEQDQLQLKELEIEARNAARDIENEMAEADRREESGYKE